MSQRDRWVLELPGDIPLIKISRAMKELGVVFKRIEPDGGGTTVVAEHSLKGRPTGERMAIPAASGERRRIVDFHGGSMLPVVELD